MSFTKATWDEIIARAKDVKAGLSRSYAQDALVFAEWLLTDGIALQENMTATQRRCTELLEENRHLRELADTAPLSLEACFPHD